MMQIGNRPDSICVLFTSIFPFYYIMLEQYYTGIMDFPLVNGVDEGTFILCYIAFAAAYYGPTQYWWDDHFNFLWMGN